MIISLTLAILVLLTFMSLILGTSWTDSLVETTIDSEAFIDDASSTFEILNTNIILNIDPIVGAIAMIIVISTFAALVGIQVLASGLSPESVRALIIGIAYTGLWGVLSILAFDLIVSIEVFGGLIYVSLSIGYVYGVINKIGGNE